MQQQHKKRSRQTFIRKERKNEEVFLDESLIGILKKFDIQVKTKLNYESSEFFLNQFEKQQLANRNFGLTIPTDTVINEELFFVDEYSRFVGVRKDKAKVGIRFKCGHDHLERLGQVINEMERLNDTTLYSHERINPLILYERVKEIERKNANHMEIQIDLKFKSISEVVSYLNLTKNENLQDEILSTFIEILDVDSKKKQVYFRLKSSLNGDTDCPSAFYLVGKIDGTESCFILDLTHAIYYAKKIFSKIEEIYKHFTPKSLQSRLFSGNNSKNNTFHDDKQSGIYRVLIGQFFVLRQTNPYYPPRFDPAIIRVPNETFRGHVIVAEKRVNLGREINYSGWIENGYYKFELKGSYCFMDELGTSGYVREFYHFVV